MVRARSNAGAEGQVGMDTTVGIVTPFPLDERDGDILRLASRVGLDHVGTGDHVSFRTGHGVDALATAASMLAIQPGIGVYIGVYVLPLRHPVGVARQLSTLAEFAPGRLTFGVGIGGEDRHEYEICGIDPGTRGRRMNEYLDVLRRLLTGESVTYSGEFIEMTDAQILPTPTTPIPIVVGGRSDAAIRRAGRYGDGWIGLWNSARRYGQGLELLEEEAERAGRADTEWQHSMAIWCGFGSGREDAREHLAGAMRRYYDLTFEPFEKYSPYGRPEDVAEFVSPYVEAGASSLNLVAIAGELEEAIEGVASVKRLLSA
jgi:alkanesulfonate monooxygenase SsuD/methylene tetrahydromethanopterin reductase-like flavin-dependent oxidoreductase (luciferase family)